MLLSLIFTAELFKEGDIRDFLLQLRQFYKLQPKSDCSQAMTVWDFKNRPHGLCLIPNFELKDAGARTMRDLQIATEMKAAAKVSLKETRYGEAGYD